MKQYSLQLKCHEKAKLKVMRILIQGSEEKKSFSGKEDLLFDFRKSEKNLKF